MYSQREMHVIILAFTVYVLYDTLDEVPNNHAVPMVSTVMTAFDWLDTVQNHKTTFLHKQTDGQHVV